MVFFLCIGIVKGVFVSGYIFVICLIWLWGFGVYWLVWILYFCIVLMIGVVLVVELFVCIEDNDGYEGDFSCMRFR